MRPLVAVVAVFLLVFVIFPTSRQEDHLTRIDEEEEVRQLSDEQGIRVGSAAESSEPAASNRSSAVTHADNTPPEGAAAGTPAGASAAETPWNGETEAQGVDTDADTGHETGRAPAGETGSTNALFPGDRASCYR